MAIRVFLLALLLISSLFLQVVKCQSESEVEVTEVVGGGDLGIVGDDVQDYGDGSFSPAPGVETVYVFPKNAARLVPAGEEAEILVGVNNEGKLFSQLRLQVLVFVLYFKAHHASPLFTNQIIDLNGPFHYFGTLSCIHSFP
uniref:Translocon-associated protein subunit alpha-like n=1 Tax=Nelumbo nucifera TaxID=4432 RepID=A0A822XYB6_NELNU|nr:TPA_asm: hypothetical protein HUJ06_023851 [Nelumbo nucifera]